jgi:hypothetical protein
VCSEICFADPEDTLTRWGEVDFKMENWVRGIAGLEYDCSAQGMRGDGNVTIVVRLVVCGGWWVLKDVEVGGKKKRLEWCGGKGGKVDSKEM